MAKLESLVVDLQVNAAELRKGLDQANAQLDGFGKKLDSLAQVITFDKIGGMAKDAATKLVDFALKGAEVADRMGKMAQSAGTTVETFSRFNYAANLSGVSTEDLGQALNKLNINLAKAGAGSKDQAALFQVLGVNVKDASGHVRDSASVMSDLAAKFSGLKDGASKSALAVELFGKSGAQLIPFLNEGATGLAALSDEADRFGITITGAAAESAQQFNDNMEKLHAITGAVAVRLAAQLTPAFTQLTDQLLNAEHGSSTLTAVVDVLAVAMKGLLSVGVAIIAIFDGVAKTLAGVIAALIAASHGQFDVALQSLKNIGVDLEKTLTNLSHRLGAIWVEPATEVKKAETSTKKSADGMVKNLQTIKDGAGPAKAALEALTKQAADMEAVVAAGLDSSPLEEFQAKLDRGHIAEQLKLIGDQATGMKERLLNAFAGVQALQAEKLRLQVEFDIKRSTQATANEIQDRQTTFGNIGRSSFEIAQQGAGGFASFDQAMKEFATQTQIYATQMDAAQQALAVNDTESARAFTDLADSAKRAADLAGRAGDAFAAQAAQWEATKSQAAGNIAGKAGAAGEIFNAGAQGFATGGPWGAIIGVIVELITKLKSFTDHIDKLNTSIGKDLGKLSQALEPFFQMAETVQDLAHGLFDFVSSGIFTILKAVLWAFSKTVTGVAIAIVEVATRFSDSFNDLTGQGKDKGLHDLKDKLAKQWSEGFDVVKTPAEETAGALNNAATAASKMSEALREVTYNLPSGYKLRAAQLGADNGQGGWNGGLGGGGSSSSSADAKDPNTHYGTAGALNYDYAGQQGNTVSQEQTSTSTKTGNGILLSAAEKAVWDAAFYAALGAGDSWNIAMWKADQALLAYQSGSGGGGGGSGGGSAWGGGGGGLGYGDESGNATVSIGEAHFHGVTDIEEMHRQLQDVGVRRTGQQSRNPQRKKGS